MSASENEDRLVGIGEQDLLVFTLGPRIKPDDGLLPFIDILDHPGAIPQYRNVNPVADGHQIPRASSLFQPPA